MVPVIVSFVTAEPSWRNLNQSLITRSSITRAIEHQKSKITNRSFVPRQRKVQHQQRCNHDDSDDTDGKRHTALDDRHHRKRLQRIRLQSRGQATERRIGEFFRRKTLMFNGYDQVASLYAGMDLKRNY